RATDWAHAPSGRGAAACVERAGGAALPRLGLAIGSGAGSLSGDLPAPSARLRRHRVRALRGRVEARRTPFGRFGYRRAATTQARAAAPLPPHDRRRTKNPAPIPPRPPPTAPVTA